jgi:hypothetical protein
MRDQRAAREPTQMLPRQAAGAAAGGDDRQHYSIHANHPASIGYRIPGRSARERVSCVSDVLHTDPPWCEQVMDGADLAARTKASVRDRRGGWRL